MVVEKKFSGSTLHERVVCNLEFPRIQKELVDLESGQFEMFSRSVDTIEQMTWDQIYKTSSKSQKRGLNWEPIEG